MYLRLPTSRLNKKETDALLNNCNQISAALEGTKAGWGTWDWRTGSGKWNKTGLALMDLIPTEEGTTAKEWMKKIHPDDKDVVLSKIRETIKNKTDFLADYRVITKDGYTRYISASGKVTFDETGYAVSSTGLIIDRTEQKKAESYLSLLSEISQDLISIKSVEDMMQSVGEKISRYFHLSNCVFVRLNDAGKEAQIVYSWHQQSEQNLLGTYMLDEFLTREFLRLGKEDKNFVVNDVSRDKRVNKNTYAKLGVRSYLAVPIVRKRKWQFFICVCHSHAHVWTIDEINLVQELTSRIWTSLERKQAEKELRSSEEKFRTVFSSMDEAYAICQMVYNEDGKATDYRMLEVNPAFERMTGIKANVAIAKTARELWVGLEDWWVDTYDSVVRNVKPVRFQNKSNILNKWYDIHASPLNEPDSGKFILVFYDITTKKKAELALQQSEERLRLAINAGDIGTLDWNLKTNEALCNATRFKMYGLKPKTGTISATEFIHNIHPEDIAYITQKTLSDIKNHGKYSVEYRVMFSDGTVRWLSENGEVIEWEEEEPLRVISILLDITDRKTEEKQKDDFFIVASHELKTPVTSIKAYTEILEELFKATGDTHSAELMQRLNGQVNRLTSLINHMLDTTRISEGQLQLHVDMIDMAELTKNVVEEMQRTTTHHQILTYSTRMPLIKGDKEKLAQVLTNFLSNAIKYSPKPTDIIVKAIHADNKIHISVQDFGIGMSSGTLKRLFQRFFRSDNPEAHTYPGLGLGLYISMEIVKKHGGIITVKSEKRKGSVFTVSLPVASIF